MMRMECVYQGHQKRILQRMREDVIRGDRCGNVRDLDEKIHKANGDESTVTSEIAQMMRIVEGGDEPNKGTLASRCCSMPILGNDSGADQAAEEAFSRTKPTPSKEEEGTPVGRCGGQGGCVLQ